MRRSASVAPALLGFEDTGSDKRVYLHLYDATHPEARRFVWSRVREHYYRQGIKVWWLDACEPELSARDHENLAYHLGSGAEVGCLYPLEHARTFCEGMQGEGEEEVITLCRSAWVGSQRYGAALWSGDIHSSFPSLREQIKAGLNVACSGIPWWTTDIGGFAGGDPNDPAFRELLVRWFQYGTFCPLFRLHGVRIPATNKTGGPNEVWTFWGGGLRDSAGLHGAAGAVAPLPHGADARGFGEWVAADAALVLRFPG